MLESRYEAIIAKPTARASGTNRAFAAPSMKNAGMKTLRMQSIASRRGQPVSAVPSSAARAGEAPRARCVWMFSTATVASSTRMPTARASPPSVIRWMDCPLTQSAKAAASSASGMFTTTMNAVRQSRRNSSTIRPVSSAPRPPSLSRSRIERSTTGDWSKT